MYQTTIKLSVTPCSQTATKPTFEAKKGNLFISPTHILLLAQAIVIAERNNDRQAS